MLKQLDEMIDSKTIHYVAFGKSATKHKRFATLKKLDGSALVNGDGDTCEEALRDALSKLPGQNRPVEVQTMPAMPGMNRMPGM